MSEVWADFRNARTRYRPLLRRAMAFFLEVESEAETVTAGALEQAERQWVGLRGETSGRNLIAMAAVDHCLLLLPRETGAPERRIPTIEQVARHLEWYDWEARIRACEATIAVRRASMAESGMTAEHSVELERLVSDLEKLVEDLMRAHFGLGDDEGASGGTPCAVPEPPPQRGPGELRTFEEALLAARDP